MTTDTTINQSLKMAGLLLTRSVEDLTDEQWVHQPVEQMDCAAWIVGHIVLVHRHVLEELGAALPALPDHWLSYYKSRPGDSRLIAYDDGATILEQFKIHHRALLAAVAHIDSGALNRKLEPPPSEQYNPLRDEENQALFDSHTVWELINRMAFIYTAQLTGEISVIRQFLKLKDIEEELFGF